MTEPAATWALITGASRGIGAAIAEQLARVGHPVIINYRSNHEAAAQVEQRIVAAGGRVELRPFDVADAEASSAAMTELVESGREIGIVVNNAGVAIDAAFPALERDAWIGVLGPTLDGFYNVTRPLVMPMVRRRWGRIINISSVSGLLGNRGQVNYRAAKAGLIGATKALAKELGKRRITVNAVAPGLIETEMVADAATNKLLEHVPLRRMGSAAEVAELVGFLASERAAYITGQVIAIDGGLT
jgi:3-oxoacyl-[acyl-carrier protein] reductase